MFKNNEDIQGDQSYWTTLYIYNITLHILCIYKCVYTFIIEQTWFLHNMDAF